MEILNLLKTKNRCFQKLLDLSEEFLAKLNSGDLAILGIYEEDWVRTFKILGFCDKQLEKYIKTYPKIDNSNLIDELTSVEALNQAAVPLIIRNNQKIISRIEMELDTIKKDLLASDKNQQLFRKFKSSWISESGEKLDGTI